MLNNVKKGDIVARKSYNKDIVFVVDSVIKGKIAILTGITARLKADAFIEDLELVNKKEFYKTYREINQKIDSQASENKIEKNGLLKRSNKIIYTGKILHLDGDKRYTEKSKIYYQKMGLNAIVKNIPENRQVNLASRLIEDYKPDILIVTRT